MCRTLSPMTIAAVLLSGAAATSAQSPTTAPANAGTDSVATAVLRPAGAATTRPTLRSVGGTVTFTPLTDGRVRVTGQVTGLEPGGVHAIHVHETPDLSSPTLDSAGGHFNPGGHPHGGPDAAARHAGDLGNLSAGPDGAARIDRTVTGLSVGTGAADDVVGRPLIVHANPDDLTSQPTGNAGDRVAGGLIGR